MSGNKKYAEIQKEAGRKELRQAKGPHRDYRDDKNPGGKWYDRANAQTHAYDAVRSLRSAGGEFEELGDKRSALTCYNAARRIAGISLRRDSDSGVEDPALSPEDGYVKLHRALGRDREEIIEKIRELLKFTLLFGHYAQSP